jgi:hypothetical protein
LWKFANKTLNVLSKVHFEFLESTAVLLKRQTLNRNFLLKISIAWRDRRSFKNGCPSKDKIRPGKRSEIPLMLK